MSDWQVGDLALCVDDTPLPYIGGCGVQRGQIYRIVACTGADGLGDICVRVGGPQGSPIWGFKAYRFRKIRPDKREACEPEFITLLKRTKVSA